MLPVVAPRQQLARPRSGAAPWCGESRPAEDVDDCGCGGPNCECAGGRVALDCRTVVGRRQQGGGRRRSALHSETCTGDWTPGPILVDGARQVASATPAPRVASRPAPRPSREVPPPASSAPPAQSAPTQTPSAPSGTPDTRPPAAAIPPPPAPVHAAPPRRPQRRHRRRRWPQPSSIPRHIQPPISTLSHPCCCHRCCFSPSQASPTERPVERTLELVIDARGVVQSAKLLERPTTSDRRQCERSRPSS